MTFDTGTITQPKESSRPNDQRQPRILSVSDVNRAIKGTLEGGYPLIWMKGELSNFKPHTSGHWYFSLKDSKAQINAVMFRGFNQAVKFRPKDGLEVIVRGKITVYEPRGNYQIFCELMEPVGAGAQQLAFAQLKEKLQNEGLFAAERKRPLPMLPTHLAVVTSPTGAAVRDILQVLKRRFAALKITIIPAVVQGDQAPASIIQALRLANQLKDIDVMIVGRGGGSTEDMWCFNDEGVARAIAAAKVPVISAVGHEIDFTIADFVADVRAPTPSAAAEMVVQSAAELSEQLELRRRQLIQMMSAALQIFRRRLHAAESRLVDPKRRLQDLSQRCDDLAARMQLAIERDLASRKQSIEVLRHRLGTPRQQIEKHRQRARELLTRIQGLSQLNFERLRGRFRQAMTSLDNLSPLKVLDRGYSITAKESGEIVTDIAQLKSGEVIHLRLSRGRVESRVEKLNP